MYEPESTGSEARKTEASPPSAKQWQEWLLEDLPHLPRAKQFDTLDHGPYRRLLEYATMPTDERECMEVILGCLCVDTPTVLRQFLAHSRVPIRNFQARVSKWVGRVRSPEITVAAAGCLADHLLKPQSKQLQAFSIGGLGFNAGAAEKLATGLSVCGALKTVRFNECLLQPHEAATLCNALKNSYSTLAELSFSDNAIGDSVAELLAARLTELPKLATLELRNCELKCTAAIALAFALGANVGLSLLDLSCNRQIGDEGGVAILDSLKSNTHLKKIDLTFCGLSDASAAKLPDLLREKTSLTSLSIGRNLLNALPSSFAKALGANKTLLTLKVDHCLAPKSVGEIATALQGNQTLAELSIGRNSPDAESIQALAKLFESSRLARIDVACSQLGNDGCELLLRALTKSPTLEVLNLGHNTMARSASKAAAELLKTSKNLVSLRLDGCDIDEFALASLSPALAQKNSVRTVDLRMNLIRDTGLPILARALEGGSLVQLKVSGNPFGAAAARKAFDAALRKNATLTTLDYPRFNDAAREDWMSINKKLWANAELSLEGTRQHLELLVQRLAFVTIGIEDIGTRVWQLLRDAANPGGELAKLRSVLRLSEVSRAIAFGPGTPAERAAVEAAAARRAAAAIIDSPALAVAAERALGDQTAKPGAPTHT